MNGNIFDREKAFTMLTAAYQNNPNDPKVLGALGMLAETRGDSQLAASLFRDLLKLAPEDLKASSNLAVLQAKGGNLQDALTLLQPVFNRNQDSIAIARNLAAIECILGDRADARSTIETALKYSPGSEDLKIGLRETSSCAVRHAQ
jgi:Flp pilus assembly protein TadD